MENAKDLFGSVRKGLENFSAQVTHATQFYKRKQEQLNGSVDGRRESQGPEVVDTLGSSVENFINVMLGLAKDLRLKADMLFRDLIEPTDLYQKHYTATNNILLENAQEIWLSLHQSRTQMMLSKENYFN